MKTLALVARKGGVSKSTLAAHIAVAASFTQRVTLIDADPQQSLAQWWSDRTADTPALMVAPVGRIASDLEAVKGEPGVVIIDSPAFDSGIVAQVIAVADAIVIPVKPSPHDFRAVAVTVEAAKRAGKPFLFVVTQAVAGSGLTMQARDVLQKTGPVAATMMHHRVAYAASMTDGRTVQELDPNGRASIEMNAISLECLQLLHETSSGGKHDVR